MVQPCRINIYNGTGHTLKYEVDGKFIRSYFSSGMTKTIENDMWEPTNRDRLVTFDSLKIKVYKVNYLKPFSYIRGCFENDNGELENYFFQGSDVENELTAIATLDPLNFPFLIKANSTVCYTISISIYKRLDEYKAEFKNPKLDAPDNLKQITIGYARADNYSVEKPYQEGDPYICSPVCMTSGEEIPNPPENCTPPTP